MATKKKAEVVEEEIKEVEVAEEAPKKTTKKSSTKKKTEVVEEASVEESVVEEVPAVEDAPVIEEPKVEEVPEVKEAPKVEEVKPIEEPKAELKVEKADAGFAIGDLATTTDRTGMFKGPSRSFINVGFLAPKSSVKVLEVSGNWVRVGANRWVNINYLKKG